MSLTSSSSELEHKAFHTGPLQIVTICTTELSAVKNILSKGLNMEINGPLTIDEVQQQRLRKLWRISELQTFQLHKARFVTKNETVQLRIVVIDSDAPSIHQTSNFRELGPSVIMVQNGNFEKVDTSIISKGVKHFSEFVASIIYLENAKDFEVEEEWYDGPDHLKFVNFKFEKPFDASSLDTLFNWNEIGICASSFVTNQIEEEIDLFTKVLGMKVLIDENVKVTLDLSDKVKHQCRVVSIAPDKLSSRRIQFIQFENGLSIDSGIPPRIPHKGVVMWSFETHDIGEVLARAHANQVKVYSTPQKVEDPIYGTAIALSLLTPSGFVLEVYHLSRS